MEKQWYAIYTKSRHEKKISNELTRRDIEHFLPFAIDPVCGKVVDPEQSGLEVTANGIAFPFCSRECVEEFERNKLDYLYCPWKPTSKIVPNFSAELHGNTIYFCCADCRDKARVFAERNDTSGTTKFFVDCFALNPGDYTRWHLPSVSPGLVEYDSAPAAGTRITATATGKRVTRCRFEPGTRFSMSSRNNASVRSIRATEVVEV